MNKRSVVPTLALAAVTAGCAAILNYQDPLGPRYAGSPSAPASGGSASFATGGRAVRVVTYNVRWGRHVERALHVLKNRAPLSDADIVLLQEMDAAGTQRIADALGMSWVYYPAGVHPTRRADFGNAILSRWPIVADGKLMLPHVGGLRHAQRIATAATVLIDSTPVRVYSAHLGTASDIRPSKRRDQALMILNDAARYPLVIVAGDMNSHGIGKEFVAQGFLWPTEHNGFTTAFFNWDHVFLKGFGLPAGDRTFTGIVRDTLGASDHDPVWAMASLPRLGP